MHSLYSKKYHQCSNIPAIFTADYQINQWDFGKSVLCTEKTLFFCTYFHYSGRFLLCFNKFVGGLVQQQNAKLYLIHQHNLLQE